MTKHLFILFLIIGPGLSNSFACDCGYEGPFLKMAKRTPLVALVKVKKYLTFKDIDGSKTPMSMEVEIIEKYKGKENRKMITVWGDIGNLCRPYLSIFKEEKYYVIAFDKGNHNSGHRDEKDTDYSITACGCYWLTADVRKKEAAGDIDSPSRKNKIIKLQTLKKRLENTAADTVLTKRA